MSPRMRGNVSRETWTLVSQLAPQGLAKEAPSEAIQHHPSSGKGGTVGRSSYALSINEPDRLDNLQPKGKAVGLFPGRLHAHCT